MTEETMTPQTLNGLAVVASMREPARRGYRPSYIVICQDDDIIRYTVWTAIWHEEGRWFADQGDYDLDWPTAVKRFAERSQWLKEIKL